MRVWDAFLTERDKEHTEKYWGKKEPFGLGQKPVLLVIDNIYGILGPRADLMEAAAVTRSSCGLEGWEAIDQTAGLIAAARRNGIPVSYATLRDDFPAGIARSDEWPQQPRHYEILDEIRPLPGDFVITKTSASMFAGTELAYWLTAMGADTVICCGNSTSGCVRATVVDAKAHRLKVGVVEECTFDRTQASHAMSLYDMHQKYADVISVAEADTYFASVGLRELVST